MGHPSLSESSSTLLIILSRTGGRPGPVDTAVNFTIGSLPVPISFVPSFELDLIPAMWINVSLGGITHS